MGQGGMPGARPTMAVQHVFDLARSHIMSQLSRSPSHMEEREFFLGPDTRVRILTTAAETDGRHDFTDTEQPAGARTPLHLHTRYDERFWVVSGSLIIWAGPETVTLRSGDYYAIPTNVPHAIETGPEGARALQISSPAGFAELIARAGTPVRLGAAAAKLDEELFMAVTTELGDIILGPPGSTPADVERG
jgi:mannose-6-phosphate isomerase-like protein (cupin superfamily)